MPPLETIRIDDRFIFRRADLEKESSALCQFFREGYGRDFSDQAIKWFMLKHPYAKSRIYVAQEEKTGRFASSICMLPFKYKWGEEIIELSLAHTGVTHPDFRRLGLFVKVNQHLREEERKLGTKFGLGFPNPQAVPGHLKAGWIIPFKQIFFEKRTFRKQPESVKPVQRFDPRFDQLYLEASKTFDLIHLKDHRVLNWRYFERPEVNYQVYACGDEKVQGFIVLKRYQDQELLKSHIVDFLALDEESGDALLACAENFALGTDLLNVWVSEGSAYQAWFLKNGFLPTEVHNPVILRSNDGSQIPNFHSPWLTLGDNDVY